MESAVLILQSPKTPPLVIVDAKTLTDHGGLEGAGRSKERC